MTPILEWQEVLPEAFQISCNPDPDDREVHDSTGRFILEIGPFIGDRGAQRTAYIAHDTQTKKFYWTSQLNFAVAWCEAQAQGIPAYLHTLARDIGRVQIKNRRRIRRQ